MLKKLLMAVVALIVIVIIAIGGVGFFVYSNLNGMVREQVRTNSEKSLTVQADLESVDLGLLSGDVGVNAFHVNNVEGFQSEKILTAKNVDTQVDLGSLFEDTIVVNSFIVDGMVVNVDQNEKGLNVDELLKRMRQRKAEQPEQPEEETKKTKRVKVSKVKFTNTTANFRLLNLQDPIVITIPEFEVNDLDKDNANGLLMDELIDQLLANAIQNIVANAEGEVGSQVLAQLNTQLKGFSQTLTTGIADVNNLIDNLSNPDGENPVNELEDTGRDIQEGIGNLLGN